MSGLIAVLAGFGAPGRAALATIDRLTGRAPAAAQVIGHLDTTKSVASVGSVDSVGSLTHQRDPDPDISNGIAEAVPTAAPSGAAPSDPSTVPESIAVSIARPATLTDLVYGEASAQQRLDLYLPAAAGPSPVVVYLHGGGWVGGDKASPDDVTLIAPLVEQGFAVVSANYRLATEARFPAQLDDARGALAWVRANAVRYGLDATRLGAFGVSAGAHLAVLLGIIEGPGAVRSVVDWAGPIDLVDMRADMNRNDRCAGAYIDPDDPSSFWAQLVGGPIGSMTAAAQATDPRSYLAATARTAYALPRFLVVHGDRDCTVPKQQSERLVDALRAAAGPDVVTFDLVPGGHAHEFPAAAELPAAADFLTATTLA